MIKIIAAVGRNNELGKDGELIWHIKGDMLFFKKQTTGHVVVMGANTYRSLPKKLTNRIHYVLTSGSLNLEKSEDVWVFSDFSELLKQVELVAKTQDVYIIGGASVYRKFLKYADEILITEIDGICECADVYFPEINKGEYTKKVISCNVENGIKYTHVSYTRK